MSDAMSDYYKQRREEERMSDIKQYWAHDDYLWPENDPEVLAEINNEDSNESYTKVVLLVDHRQQLADAKAEIRELADIVMRLAAIRTGMPYIANDPDYQRALALKQKHS